MGEREELLHEACFLLDRLEELSDAEDDEYVVEFEGHVRPSMSRLRRLTKAAIESSAPAQGVLEPSKAWSEYDSWDDFCEKTEPENRTMQGACEFGYAAGKTFGAALRAPEAADAGAVALPFGYKAPFSVSLDRDDIVYLTDADGIHVATFNTHTQLPLSRSDLLDEEREEWKSWAELLASLLNAKSASPSDAGMRAGLYIDDNAIEWLCAEVFGKVMVAKANDCTTVSKDLFEQWGWRVTSTDLCTGGQRS